MVFNHFISHNCVVAYTTTNRRKLAAIQTDREANSPPQQLTAKARGSKNHFAPYRFATIVYLMTV